MHASLIHLKQPTMQNRSTALHIYLLLAIAVLALAASSAQAQTTTGSGTEVTISSGTQVSLQGSWTNNGIITNQGSLSLTGNWQNNGVYLGNGKLVLNGTTLQIVDNNDTPIDSLVVDGGGEKQLQGNFTIMKSMVFVNGVVTPDPTGDLTMADGATVNGASQASYVNGVMYRTGTGDLLFPIGNAANYLPVEVLAVSGANPVFAFEVVEPNTGAQPDIGLEAVSDVRYWQRLQRSGTFNGGIVRLPVVNETSVTDFNRVNVTEAGPSGNTFSLLGRSASTGNATQGTVTASAPFTGSRLAVGMSLTTANAADSIALVVLYQTTDGDNWTNTLNGNQPWGTGPLETWFGVTVQNGRVTAVELPGNGLSGQLPATMKNLTMLQTLDLSNNQIEGTLPTEWVNLVNLTTLNLANNNLTNLADLTSGVFLNTLNVAGNALLFEPLLAYTGVANFTYNNQGTISLDALIRNRFIPARTNASLDAVTRAAGNQYRWFKDGAVTGATEQLFTIVDAGRQSFGNYYAEITNPTLADLTLRTDSFDVKVIANISGTVFTPDNLPLQAGSLQLLEITSVGRWDSVDVTTVSTDGRFTFANAVLKDYIIAVDASPNVHPDILLTYYSDAITWTQADTLVLVEDVDTLRINTVQIPPPTSGPNTIAGILEEEFEEQPGEGGRVEARRRIRRGGIALRKSRVSNRTENDDDFELVAFIYTGEEGTFDFSGLPDGLYRISVEIPGLPMDPNSFIEFRLGSGAGLRSSLDLRAVIETEVIQVFDETIVGFDDQRLGALQLYPNPANQQVQVSVQGNLTNEYQVSIVDMYGKEVYNSARQPSFDQGNAYMIDVGNLKGGLYLVNVYRKDKNKRNIRVARLLIRR